MKSLSSNIAFWLIVGGLTTYAALFSLSGYDITIYVIGALIFGVSLLVIITWASTALEAIRTGAREGEAMLALAICGFALAALYQRGWVIVKKVLEEPPWMDTSPFGPLAGWLIFLALTAILLAPGTRRGNIPRVNWMYWFVAGVVGGLFIGVTIGAAFAERDAGGPFVLNCSPEKPVQVAAFCRRMPTP